MQSLLILLERSVPELGVPLDVGRLHPRHRPHLALIVHHPLKVPGLGRSLVILCMATNVRSVSKSIPISM